MKRFPAYIYLFDLLYLERYDVTQLPLEERKKLLRQAVRWTDRVRWTDYQAEKGTALWQQACRQGGEGIIGKQRKSPYVLGRSPHWVKIKCIGRQEFVIGGFTDPQRSRAGFGAIRPKWHRVSPRKGLKRILSPQSGWEALKSLLKFAVLTAVAWPTLAHLTAAVTRSDRMPLGQLLWLVGATTLRLVRNTGLAGLALAAADYAFQRRRVKKATMMTRQEVKEEHRQSDGDPFMRSRIRQRQAEMSRNRMMAAVGKATVVVVNPTHIAVALRYTAGAGAPKVVAKGRGFVAARIREEAERHDVPVVRDVPLARTLHATGRLDREIPAELYEAVARLLAFVFSLRRRTA